MQNQVLGRGKLYFELYAPGTFVGQGERYLGNTPSFAVKNAASTLDEFDSMDETIARVESTTTQDDLSLAFAADDVSNDNLAAWFAASTQTITQANVNGLSETITVFRDRYFQLGRVAAPPTGYRNVVDVTASVNPSLNFSFDRASGRVYVLPNAPNISLSGTAVEFFYDLGAETRVILVHKQQKIRGALRFVSANPVGNNSIYYFPYVVLQPGGDFQLKVDDWQKLNFTASVLKMNSSTDRVYTDAEVVSFSATDSEEQALTYGTEAEIIAWANQLHQVIDVQLPPLPYP